MAEIYVSTDVEVDGPIPGSYSMLSFGSAAFDFMFIYWYLIQFAGRSPFSFSALDIKTMAMVILGKDYRRCTKRNMPQRWFDDLPHTHVALDDAIEQGRLFCNMLAECRRR